VALGSAPSHQTYWATSWEADVVWQVSYRKILDSDGNVASNARIVATPEPGAFGLVAVIACFFLLRYSFLHTG